MICLVVVGIMKYQSESFFYKIRLSQNMTSLREREKKSQKYRIVFDASIVHEERLLPDILAKRRNNMNKPSIFDRWRGHAVAFHTDVQKMSNSLKLDASHWGLKRYL